MNDGRLVLSFALVEGMHLARLVDQFRDLVDTGRITEDAAVARLTPDVYPQDDDASRNFREATRDDLLDRRIADATVVRVALGTFAVEAEDISDDGALAEREIEIPITDIDSWLRTLTAIRLVIATRLGIVDDDDHDSDDPRYGIYDWLGYRLEGIIQAADG